MIEKKLALVTGKGEEIHTFSIRNESGIELVVTNYGAAVYRLRMPDREGNMDDIVLTCDSMEKFMHNTGFFGATVGRVANRIRDGYFELNDTSYQLSQNEGTKHAHGGHTGFDKHVWDWKIKDNKVLFLHQSPDGNEGYPGNLSIEVTYELTDSGEVQITYTARSDKDTILNTINHAYFNLGGIKSGKIYHETLKIEGNYYLETDGQLIPTGQILSVKDTPYDFTTEKEIGQDIENEFPAVVRNRGYDVTFVRKKRGYGRAAVLKDSGTGRCLEVLTDYPSIHLYTGNFLENEPGWENYCYNKHESVCLEAQRFPYACEYPHFGDIILRAGEEYKQRVCYRLYLE